MLELLLKFLLVHVVGDFVFQPNKWVKDKKKNKIKSPYLYVHILVHALIFVVVFQFDLKYWLGGLIMLVSHFLIDAGKLYSYKLVNNRILFFVDQALHVAIILGVVGIYYPVQFDWNSLYSNSNLLLLLFVILVTSVTSIVMKVLISKWNPAEEKKSSLPNAGAYIGMLERLFIFGFIMLDFWSGIGFLLASKSVFRFGDLTKAKNRSLTEYILIGTLLSFGIAILFGVTYVHLDELLAAR